MTLNTSDRKDWIRLARSENVGPITFKNLITYFHSPKQAIARVAEFAQKGGARKKIEICSDALVNEELERADQIGAELILSCDSTYPYLLQQIEDKPPVLTALGQASVLNKKCFAMVGTRNASLNAKTLTRKLAFDLADAGYVVVSGMARGIDTAAHQGALGLPTGETVAVLGTGVDVVYPSENKSLYDQILAHGVVVSELPMGMQPFPNNFPRRNRIISGLSQGVLVVEAQAKSGSLITAQMALDQNRIVFAVPGNPLDMRAQGPNLLLKNGAHLVENVRDILDLLPSNHLSDGDLFNLKEQEEHLTFPDVSEKDMDQVRSVVINHLGPHMTDVDELIRESQLPVQLVNVVLVELELAGRIERFPGNRVALIV